MTPEQMTSEQLRLVSDGERIIDKLHAAVHGEDPRTVMFAITAFSVATAIELGRSVDEFVTAIRAAQSSIDREMGSRVRA